MSIQSVIPPMRPDSPDWELLDLRNLHGYPAERWISKFGHVAITAVEVVENSGLGPEYHVSISKNGGRVSADEVPGLLKLFGMEGSDEDNHVPGAIARNFWMPVDESKRGYVCPCKETETVVIEGDYEWRPVDEGKGK
ncbi:MAG: hypothetical protein Q8L60_10440 [Gammaproteobacteria bacterium]|nr:hypothetical protein [Gammaproteobacteria bacterium]MDP2346767.1 hypothetical protein [Gammaproteobacteria bacterium]